ncbi:MAG: HAMP domain-containing histidine kinase [Gemmatimonadota bacterium]|nr:HAMP domain-containing histidine kinase [Gemmatimonadota bacterium]
MASSGHRRQVLLFLVAIILPCVVLVVLGLRMVAQERELSENRRADERRRVANQIRQDLSSRLERIALQEATAVIASPDRLTSTQYGDPSVALVGRVTNGRLTLPWEHDVRRDRFQRLQADGEVSRLIREAEREELVVGNADRAVELYGEALAAARDPARTTYARLLRARALGTAGRRQASQRDCRRVLAADLDIVDEHGVPLALYVADRLLEAGSDAALVRERVTAAIHTEKWLSPPAIYLLRDLVAGLRASAPDSIPPDIESAVEARRATTEQAIALQRDFQSLGLGAVSVARVHGTDNRWVPYGTPTWLIGASPSLGDEPGVIVAVRADSAFRAAEARVLEASEVNAVVTLDSEEVTAELLGASFPGVTVQFPDAITDAGGGPWGVRRWFYLVAVLLVLSVTLFGAYLVSQDVRRELRVAEMRSRFVSAVSHELKTPLTAIRMFAETLQLGRSQDEADQEEYLETIVNESERLTRLLNNVLDFSKIERGKKTYRRMPSSLAEIVEASARAMQYPLEQQQFALTLDIEDDLPDANVDRDAIEQAILNLLANAMKYSGESRDIDLRLKRINGKALIEVADRGVGIDVDEQPKIFEQFYRVPSKNNDGIPGTGLGLTLVRHIAEGHGGRVTVASAPGRGTTFAIHLPLEGSDA